MGLLSILRKMKKDERESRILMLGLDNSGKTTILRRLAGESDEMVKTTAPTQGFNIKSVQHDGPSFEQESFKLNIWDIGGQAAIRDYWGNYYDAADALVYVIDSADSRRMEETAGVLQTLLAEEKLQDLPVLVFCNKQDCEPHMEAEEIRDQLGLTDTQINMVIFQACSAYTGDGLEDGMKELMTKVAGRG